MATPLDNNNQRIIEKFEFQSGVKHFTKLVLELHTTHGKILDSKVVSRAGQTDLYTYMTTH